MPIINPEPIVCTDINRFRYNVYLPIASEHLTPEDIITGIQELLALRETTTVTPNYFVIDLSSCKFTLTYLLHFISNHARSGDLLSDCAFSFINNARRSEIDSVSDLSKNARFRTTFFFLMTPEQMKSALDKKFISLSDSSKNLFKPFQAFWNGTMVSHDSIDALFSYEPPTSPTLHHHTTTSPASLAASVGGGGARRTPSTPKVIVVPAAAPQLPHSPGSPFSSIVPRRFRSAHTTNTATDTPAPPVGLKDYLASSDEDSRHSAASATLAVPATSAVPVTSTAPAAPTTFSDQLTLQNAIPAAVVTTAPAMARVPTSSPFSKRAPIPHHTPSPPIVIRTITGSASPRTSDHLKTTATAPAMTTAVAPEDTTGCCCLLWWNRGNTARVATIPTADASSKTME